MAQLMPENVTNIIPLVSVPPSEDTVKLEVHSENLASIERKIGNRQIAIFSVVGPQKSGKSLLFAHFIKYLKATENDVVEWIDWKDKTKPLDECRWPNNSSSTDNPGIYCYHRPFILTIEDDQDEKDVAVILLFSQSSEKYKWMENKISSALTGLSILSSSLTIFNVSKQVDESLLSSMTDSIYHAMTGIGKIKGLEHQPQAAFQDARVLIRDWSYPTDYPYGAVGGRNYLKLEKLREKSSQTKDARANRQILAAAFGNLSGYLLPYPGNAVLKSSFKGCLLEMEADFVKCLKNFVEDVINVDNLVLKRDISGSLVSADEWKKTLERNVELVNTGDQVDMDKTKLLTCLGAKPTRILGEEKQHIKTSLKIYGKCWEKFFAQENVIQSTEKAMSDNHTKAEKRAIKALKKEMIPENTDVDETINKLHKKAKKQLQEKLQQKFEEQKQEFGKLRQSFVEKCMGELIEQYNSSMDAAFSRRRTLPTEAELKSNSAKFIIAKKKQFLEKVGETGGEEKLSESIKPLFLAFCNKLQKAEDKISRSLLPKEDHHQLNDRSSGESLNVYNDFKHSMTSLSSNDTFEIASHKSSETKSSISKLSGNYYLKETPFQINNLSSSPPLAEKLKPSDQSKHKLQKSSRQQQKLREEALKEQTQILIDKLKMQYISMLNEETKNDTNFGQIDAQLKAKIFREFESKCEYQQGGQEYNIHKEILEHDIKMALDSTKSKYKKASRTQQKNLEKLIDNTIAQYEERLKSYLSKYDDIETQKLEKVHVEVMEDELKKLSMKISGNDFENHKPKIENDINALFQKFKNQIERKHNISTQNLKRLINDCKLQYNGEITKAMTSSNDEIEFKNLHDKIKKNIIEKLKSQYSKDEKKENFMNEMAALSRGIDEAFEEFQKMFQMKIESSIGASKMASQEAINFYKKEMDKNFKNHKFIAEADLQVLHKKACEMTIKKYSPKTNQAELKQMKETLENLYKIYKDENNMNMNVEPAIGIDLGTTFSCVAVYQKGKVEIIPNSAGKLTTPSYVLFQPDGEEIVGVSAKERAYENPEGTIFDAKRILGRKFDDDNLQEDMKLWAFTVVDGGRGVPMIEVNGKKYNPEMISAKVLEQLKKDAEEFLKRKVTKAVITVPAYFTDGQKQATVDAGKMAGLEVLSILTEPVAAAMAYKLQYSDEPTNGGEPRHILVFDLGGGTFDVAILKTTKGELEVLTVDGDTHLGGEDFDKNMMDYCAAEFKKTHKIDLFEGKDSPKKIIRDDVRRRLKRLQAECERQKITLASRKSADVALDNIYKDFDLKVTLTRAKFEEINKDLFDSTIELVQKALKAAKLDRAAIDDVVLVGGSTRIPKIQKMLQDFFGGKELDKKINPDEAVAHGAGLLAAIRKGNVGQDSAAFTKIQDVTPMPIGVEVYGGGFSIIIPKSTKTPVKCQEMYKTAHNNQTSVQITIYEGENKVAVKNKKLGDFYLNGIPPKEAGVENIDVEMVISDQGILHVTAKCRSTGTTKAVTVTENKQRMGQAAITRYIAGKETGGR